MPIYQYQCEKCNTIFEELLNKPSDKKGKCPNCESPSKKIPTNITFILKGPGWAADSYTPKK